MIWLEILMKMNEPTTMTKLSKIIKTKSRDTIAIHLKKLEKMSLVISEKIGREKIYTPTEKALGICKIMEDVNWRI